MLILNQDRDELVYLGRIYLIKDKPERKYNVYVDNNKFGTYATEERAKQILTDILRREEQNQRTYLMPEE